MLIKSHAPAFYKITGKTLIIQSTDYSLIIVLFQVSMEEYVIYIGIGAGVCTAISMLPQLVKIIKDKKAEDISFWMLLILLAGISGWIWYGFLKKDYPIIITNIFSLVVNLLIIGFSLKYKKNK